MILTHQALFSFFDGATAVDATPDPEPEPEPVVAERGAMTFWAAAELSVRIIIPDE